MAIEKLSLINLVGNMSDLNQTLLCCLKSGCFHPELSVHSTQPTHGFSIVEGDNPFTAPLNNAIRVAEDLSLTLKKGSDFEVEMPNDEQLASINEYIASVSQKIQSLVERKKIIKEEIFQYEQALIQLNHVAGLDASFDDIFTCEYVKVRFGRLPYDSYSKLQYYDNKTFFFFPFDHNKEYYWGVYFAPSTKIAVIDDIFASLYFERVRLPEFLHGTPEESVANIEAVLNKNNLELTQISDKIAQIKDEQNEKLLDAYSTLKLASTAFDLRKYVATVNNRFYLIGFVPKRDRASFEKLFASIKSVDCVAKPFDADPSISAPVKLKNNRFTKPFEMFVKMYSLPSYKDIDLTSFVAISYTILFGIMFGDLGQGLVIALIGFILGKYKKMELGRIMTRIGFSSAFFGLIYGSVFGYEHLLDPMYHALGFAEKPIEVFDTSVTNILLIAAIGIGVLLIVISICINIYLGFKNKDIGRAIFSNNGVAGLVFYLAAAFAVADMMVLQIGVMNLAYTLCLIVLPLLCMFLRGPLTKLCTGDKNFMPKNIGEFILENFFELFEYVLSYLSNSMSFLRVGGFILSHAGMMAVVMSLSEMVGSTASPIVVVIGNIFVMCLEGLIVGIQVLRLEFYEIFSRNFEGNGKPYIPATVVYEVEKAV